MCTANKLEGSLSALKRRLGLTFIKFEDAAVELEPFVRAHVFDTASYLGRQMLAHFKDVSGEGKLTCWLRGNPIFGGCYAVTHRA